MAVQKSKKSRAKRGTRRAHTHMSDCPLTVDSVSGETHRMHHVTDTLYYRGEPLLDQ